MRMEHVQYFLKLALCFWVTERKKNPGWQMNHFLIQQQKLQRFTSSCESLALNAWWWKCYSLNASLLGRSQQAWMVLMAGEVERVQFGRCQCETLNFCIWLRHSVGNLFTVHLDSLTCSISLQTNLACGFNVASLRQIWLLSRLTPPWHDKSNVEMFLHPER